MQADGERRAVLGVEGPQLLLAGLDAVGQVLGQELELLGQAPAHDRVVAVQPQREALPVGGLLADVIGDQPDQLVAGGGAPPGALETRDEVLDLARAAGAKGIQMSADRPAEQQ